MDVYGRFSIVFCNLPTFGIVVLVVNIRRYHHTLNIYSTCQLAVGTHWGKVPGCDTRQCIVFYAFRKRSPLICGYLPRHTVLSCRCWSNIRSHVVKQKFSRLYCKGQIGVWEHTCFFVLQPDFWQKKHHMLVMMTGHDVGGGDWWGIYQGSSGAAR